MLPARERKDVETLPRHGVNSTYKLTIYDVCSDTSHFYEPISLNKLLSDHRLCEINYRKTTVKTQSFV